MTFCIFGSAVDKICNSQRIIRDLPYSIRDKLGRGPNNFEALGVPQCLVETVFQINQRCFNQFRQGNVRGPVDSAATSLYCSLFEIGYHVNICKILFI